MTEAEAKTRWCPFGRSMMERRIAEVAKADGGNRGQDGAPLPSSMCIGSACMAWRERKGVFHLGRKQFLERGDTYSDSDPVEYRSTGEGFCGLAGKP